MTTPVSPTPIDSTTRADPCPEIPGEVRTWNGFDAYFKDLLAIWPEIHHTLVFRNPLTLSSFNIAGEHVGYVQRDRTVKDPRWRRFGVSGKIRAR